MMLWSIQVMRFVAAILVVHLHAAQRTFEYTGDWGMLGPAAGILGRAGVDIFFVISGLIITRTAKGLSAGAFLGKRARRILPLYLLLSIPFVITAFNSGQVGWRDLVATGLLWPATDVITPPLLPVGWTLCFEALFYVAFAIVIWRPRALWLLIPAYLGALAWRQGAVLQFIGNPIVLEFLVGVALAYAPRFRPALLAIPLGVAILIIGAALHWPPGGGEIEFLSGREAWIRLVVVGAPSAMIIWGALQIDAKPGVLTALGDASYALYLVHALIVAGAVVILAGLPALPADAIILGATAAALLVGWTVHALLEKPLLALFSLPRPAAASA